MERIHDVNKLIHKGIDLMVANGYHNTSINEVIRQAGLPKGSFYYLYKDKKAFALAAIQYYSEGLLVQMDDIFSRESLSPIEAIKTYYNNSVKNLKQAQYAHGCFLGNMGQEMSDVDEDFRHIIEQAFTLIRDRLSEQLVKAQGAGEIGKSVNTHVYADIINNFWHGALLRMKASRSKEPLDQFMNDFFILITCNV